MRRRAHKIRVRADAVVRFDRDLDGVPRELDGEKFLDKLVAAFDGVDGAAELMRGARVRITLDHRPTTPDQTWGRCSANVRRHGTLLVCRLPSGHRCDHNTSEDSSGDSFPNLEAKSC